ncbi:class II aaRS and biotin synthetases superfamily protein [Wolffia australiana]
MATSSSSAVSVGGKGGALTSSVVYAVSRGLISARIDSSALEKLSSSKKTSKIASLPDPSRSDGLQSARYLSPEDARAALFVILHKLCLSNGVGPIVVLVEEVLGFEDGQENLDFGSAFGFLASLCKLGGKSMAEIGFTSEEISLLDSSLAAAATAVAAILDAASAALTMVLDSAASLSCEAAAADPAAAFELPGSGDGFSIKDETDVAGDLKMMLFGSKFSGRLAADPFTGIPAVHGCFRSAVRAFHGRTRIELNSAIRSKKDADPWKHEGKSTMAGAALALCLAARTAGKFSIGRARAVIAAIADANLRAGVSHTFEVNCPSFDSLRILCRVVSEKAADEADDVEVLREAHKLVVKLREILAWEASIALFAIEKDEAFDKVRAEPNNSELNGSDLKKGEKKKAKKKKTLGRGTSVIRQRMLEFVNVSMDDSSALCNLARGLLGYFDPKCGSLDLLLKDVKEIVESNEIRRLPKIPKGTRDFGKDQMAVRERAFSIIVDVFKKHGATALDTPVFELRETLMGKYGEDSKLIYDLADQGGEICSLRYDLTVPFARYVAMNNISSLKRYQIAKVYRRDNPSKGRYREFYQCDFDIAGQYEPMEPDFEVIKVLTELLDALNIGEYEVKLNHRKLLDGMLAICGVGPEKFRTVCSSIDKLDKQPFEQIKKELVEEKGLPEETAEKIGEFVKKRGEPFEILRCLKEPGSPFLEHEESLAALADLEILFRALEKSKSVGKIVFDLSLARGLDYYTGVIFEAAFRGATQVGSIAAGGRYDNLVGMFSGKNVPAVGISLGIERVFTIMEQLAKDQNQSLRATETEVLVAVLGKDLALAAELVSEMWAAGIKAEFGIHKKVMKHIDRARQARIPWLVLVGELELEKGIVKLKNIDEAAEEEISRGEIVEQLIKRMETKAHVSSLSSSMRRAVV